MLLKLEMIQTRIDHYIRLKIVIFFLKKPCKSHLVSIFLNTLYFVKTDNYKLEDTAKLKLIFYSNTDYESAFWRFSLKKIKLVKYLMEYFPVRFSNLSGQLIFVSKIRFLFALNKLYFFLNKPMLSIR